MAKKKVEKKVIDLKDLEFENNDYNDRPGDFIVDLPSDYVIHNQWSNVTRQRDNGEILDPKSITVPGESLTVKEILKRHLSGRPLPQGRMPIYDSENDIRIPDLEKMDKMQVADLHRQMQEAEQEYNRKQQELEKQLQEEKEQKFKQLSLDFEKLQKDYETMQKFQNENNTPNKQDL